MRMSNSVGVFYVRERETEREREGEMRAELCGWRQCSGSVAVCRCVQGVVWLRGSVCESVAVCMYAECVQ